MELEGGLAWVDHCMLNNIIVPIMHACMHGYALHVSACMTFHCGTVTVFTLYYGILPGSDSLYISGSDYEIGHTFIILF